MACQFLQICRQNELTAATGAFDVAEAALDQWKGPMLDTRDAQVRKTERLTERVTGPRTDPHPASQKVVSFWECDRLGALVREQWGSREVRRTARWTLQLNAPSASCSGKVVVAG